MVDHLRVSEVYTSIQGEGPNTGLPTQFVRFAGCNLRCPGWPCDTQFAIEPKLFLNDPSCKKQDPPELIDRVEQWPKAVTLTGGEPFVQPHVLLQEFVEALWNKYYTVECFTNGTFLIPGWARPAMRFVLDWKLPGSGEFEKCKDSERDRNAILLSRYDSIKFVCNDTDDLVTAQMEWERLRNLDVMAQFWVGQVWDSSLSNQQITNFVLANHLPWRLNVQMHNYIWSPQERGR